MRERVLPFLGGLMAGIIVGALVAAVPMSQSMGSPALLAGVAVVMFVAGLLLGRRWKPTQQEVRFTGRVFEFPQGSAMVEVALRRMRSVLPSVPRGE